VSRGEDVSLAHVPRSGAGDRQRKSLRRFDPHSQAIFRWVSWARGPAAQQARLKLVLHSQHARLSRGGWLPEAALGAAFHLWCAVVDEAHRRGLAGPRPDAIPWADYRKAIVERPKGRRRKAFPVAPVAEGVAEARVRVEPATAPADSAPTEAGEGPARFSGMVEGRCVIDVAEDRLEDAEVVAAALCHVVAHAYRARHGLAIGAVVEGHYREMPARNERRTALEERLTDVTAIYLGLGVLAANGAHRQRTSGRMVGSYATWQMSTERLGTLGPHAASYLLDAQVVVRGLDAAARKRLAAHLEINQAAYFSATCADLESAGVEALRERLGVPDPSAWPPPPDLAALTAPYTGDRPVPRARPNERRLEAEGTPVFRVRDHWGITFSVLAGIAAWLAIGHVTDGNLIIIGIAVAFAIPLGFRLGRRVGAFQCASCETRLDVGAEVCSGCGGHVIGEIARREDRLAALEEHEAKHPRERWTAIMRRKT
jgi:hypothetical protein